MAALLQRAEKGKVTQPYMSPNVSSVLFPQVNSKQFFRIPKRPASKVTGLPGGCKDQMHTRALCKQ